VAVAVVRGGMRRRATSAAGGRRAVVFAAAVPPSNTEYKDSITMYTEVVKTSAANYADAIKSYEDALKWATGALITVLLAGGAAFYVLYAEMANLSLQMATAQAHTSTEVAGFKKR